MNCSEEHKENFNLKIEGDRAEVYSGGSWQPMEKAAALKSFHKNKKKELAELNQSDLAERLSCSLRSRLEFIAEDNEASAAKRECKANTKSFGLGETGGEINLVIRAWR